MAVTNFSPLLGLALPTTGDLTGTWGDVVNTQITDLIDDAVAGTTTLSTDADVTLTSTNGVNNQARQAILNCTGARTALRTITAPATSKTYIVNNATTGGFDVKLVGAGPTTGVTLPAGSSMLVSWNGSDFEQITQRVISVNSTSDALRITQTGTGNALVVEDAANPDSTPFVIDANGRVLAGTSTALTVDGSLQGFQIVGDGGDKNAVLARYQGTANGSTLYYAKARGSVASPSAVVASDTIGLTRFMGFDGTAFISGATISAAIDGTPGTNDMPGRLVFSTTPDGSDTPEERLRITSDGRTLIGNSAALTTRISTTSISPFLQVAGASTERTQVGIFAANANPSFLFAKSNGSVNTPTVVTESQVLGRVSAAGYDGTQFTEAANIIVSVDGTPGTNDMPGRILFSTTPDGGVTPVERLRIDSAGTVTLAATSGLSIGRTTVTSPATTDGNVFSGTYTPTLTNVTNVAASTASVLQYMRVGNYVQMAGRVTIDPTATGTTTIRMSIPVASGFGSVVQAGGTFSGTSGEVGFITAIAATDDLQFQYTATSTANNAFQFTVGYQVF